MQLRQKIIPFLAVISGLLLFTYPFFSNYLYEKSAGSSIEGYQKKTLQTSKNKIQSAWKKAKIYNQELAVSKAQLTDPFQATQIQNLKYTSILNADPSGIMGYIDIPCISVKLPIYHGTSAEVLEKGVGHLVATSFPVGGKNTHAVLTAHTGLSSAKLFTDLTEMKKDDVFFLHVLDRTLAYKVDQISVVQPEDTTKLQIVDGKDYVTLVTCTPYGVNSHRLFVRGIRTAYHEEQEKHIPVRKHSSQWMKTYQKAIIFGLLILLIAEMVRRRIQKIRKKRINL